MIAFLKAGITSFVTIILFSACSSNPPDELSSLGVPGSRIYSENGYVEYIIGNIPVIISAPHGGMLGPDTIPARTYGQQSGDYNTDKLAKAISDAFYSSYGKYPHVIINHLRRDKLDANTYLKEAAQGNEMAERAWIDFHSYINIAKEEVATNFGMGLFIDLHGHSHPTERIEIGYNLRPNQLNRSNSELNELIDYSSIRSLANFVSIDFSQLIRGKGSLGQMLEGLGYPAIPSPSQASPGEAPYFYSGPNTERHSSLSGGKIDGLQIEVNRNIRWDEKSIQSFAEAFTKALSEYFYINYKIKI